MAFLLGSLRAATSVRSGKSGVESWRRAPAPVRQLFWRVRRAVLRPKRRAVSFGYDLKSYSQNFGDGGLLTAYPL